MSCLSATRKAEIETQITRYETLLSATETALLEIGEIKEFRFDSGEGSQKTEYQDVNKLAKLISFYQSQLDWLRNKLNGTGLANLNLRRKQYFS